jgi:8-oxo-dGTP diphosphatase
VTGAKPLVNVAVAVVQRGDGRVLLAERPRGKISGGYSELPGGKFHAVEKSEQALARKPQEEIGIKLDRTQPWITYEYEYPDKRVWQFCIGGLVAGVAATNNHWRIPVRYTEFSTFPE